MLGDIFKKLMIAANYATKRAPFGRPICQYDSIGIPLAEAFDIYKEKLISAVDLVRDFEDGKNVFDEAMRQKKEVCHFDKNVYDIFCNTLGGRSFIRGAYGFPDAYCMLFGGGAETLMAHHGAKSFFRKMAK